MISKPVETIEQLRARLDVLHAKATPGDWFTRRNHREAPDDMIVMAQDGISTCECAPGNPFMTLAEATANAALVAALKTAWPAISAALAEREDAIARARLAEGLERAEEAVRALKDPP